MRELLEFPDKEVPEEERFKAMKSIFFMAVSKDATEADEILAYELMQIGKKLTSNDIMLLRAAYGVYISGNSAPAGEITRPSGTAEWLNIVAKKIGHGISALVELSEQNLIYLKLIGRRLHSDGSGIDNKGSFRLTELGIKWCKFTAEYQ